jgi:hypothetical protein
MATKDGGSPQNADEGRSDLYTWLEEKLRVEQRCHVLEMERRYRSLLVEFAEVEQSLSVKNGSPVSLNEPPRLQNQNKPRLTNKRVYGSEYLEAQKAENAQASGKTDNAKEDPAGQLAPVTESGPEQFTSMRQIGISKQQLIHDVVAGKRFECFFGGLILVNTVILAAEAQYKGISVGYSVKYAGYDQTKESAWPGGEFTFSLLNWVFGILFTLEIVAKLVGLRREFFGAWNMFDAVVMLFWYLDTLLSTVELPIDMMLLRLLRLARLLRLLKLAKAIAGFDQLFLMIASLRGSARMLGWTAVLLFSLLCMFAFIANQTLVAYYIEDDAVSMEKRRNAFLYFGNFSRSIMSMFELTIGNWLPISRFLVENVSEWFIIFALLYKVTFGFSVIAVINSCFIKETFKVAAADDLLMVLEKEKEGLMHLHKMRRLLDLADSSGEGRVSQEEFSSIFHDKEVRLWMLAQGLDTSDAPNLFELMDDGSGELSSDELIKGVSKLKGPARELDLALLTRDTADREKVILMKLDAILAAQSTYDSVACRGRLEML